MATSFSRLVIAGLSGDSGKTIASLSLLTALKEKEYSVSVFKKGPDYIDPAWLSMASQAVCRNLDTYLVNREDVLRTFLTNAHGTDISIIEGNRGLFDGKDAVGSHSTAELAKLLDAPVVLVVDTSKTTRTVAAIVNGCISFDPDVRIAGVIINKVAGERHCRVVTDSIREYCKLPVLGAIPKLGEDSTLIPGRHLGLITPDEYQQRTGLASRLTEIAREHLDIDGLVEIARSAGPLPGGEKRSRSKITARVKIGFFKDSVFTFYYPENLEALEANGAELVPISSLEDSCLPDIDGLYIGGGFPETHADRLTCNKSMMESVRRSAEEGLPVYAECGGLIYLARSLEWKDKTYPMTGLFPVDLRMHSRPVGHGYTLIKVDKTNPYFEVGTKITGHEFHYSGPINHAAPADSCMKVETGIGLGMARDGLIYNNVLACYCHIHADGVKDWAASLISKAVQFSAKRSAGKAHDCHFEKYVSDDDNGVAVSTGRGWQLQTIGI